MKKIFLFCLLPLLYPVTGFADLCKGVLLSKTENCGFSHHAGEVLTGLHAGKPDKKHQPKLFEQQHVRCPWPAQNITLVNCHLISKEDYPYFDMILNDTPDGKTHITYQKLYEILSLEAGLPMNKASNLARLYLRDPKDSCAQKIDLFLSARKMGRTYPQRAWMAQPCPLMPSISVNNPSG